MAIEREVAAAMALAGATSPGMGLSPFPDPTLSSMPQIVFLAVVYGYVLFQAANLLSDGSELLLLIPRIAPVVGSIVLPVLGAVPDGMMVLFSGLGPDAQSDISVGVGALAGSTIMLLTVPWFLAVHAGRVSIKDGKATYARPADEPNGSWAKLMPEDQSGLVSAGVGVAPSIKNSAKIMLLTLVGYVVIQGAAFTQDSFHTPKALQEVAIEARGESYFALAGLVVCTLGLAIYMWVSATAEESAEHEDPEGQVADEDVQSDIPEDLADLAPAEQQQRIVKRAITKMAIGTFLVIAFSDPMVDLLSELGSRLNISPFYVSFVLAPIASNSSELVAAYHYASKRTLKSITTSLSTLTGAAIMNNTFCLGIFLGLVYFKRLAWDFSAETIAIVVVQILVAILVLTSSVMTLKSAYVVLALYPGTLLLVWSLENLCGLD